MEANFLILVIPGRALLARARNPYSLWWLWIPGLRRSLSSGRRGRTRWRRPGMTADFTSARIALLRRLAMRTRQPQQHVVIHGLDRREIAMGDIVRPGGLADIIRDRVQRQIDDL